MPYKDNILKFNNVHKQLPVSFVIYAYFEAITENYKDANQTLKNQILKHVKNINTVDMVITLFVVMMISIPDQFKFIKEKVLYTNSWRRC